MEQILSFFVVEDAIFRYEVMLPIAACWRLALHDRNHSLGDWCLPFSVAGGFISIKAAWISRAFRSLVASPFANGV